MIKRRIHPNNYLKEVVIASAILIVIIILFVLSIPKNCKDNEECFNSASSICKKAKANLLKDEDVYNYYIRGKKDDNCVVKITMLQVSEKKSLSMKEGLEGRYMDCAVPMKLMSEKPINKMSEINDYCTGPLKEAILEISLQKMYELIVKDIGNVTIALQEVIAGLEKK